VQVEEEARHNSFDTNFLSSFDNMH
jgi:hypothetical protein